MSLASITRTSGPAGQRASGQAGKQRAGNGQEEGLLGDMLVLEEPLEASDPAAALFAVGKVAGDLGQTDPSAAADAADEGGKGVQVAQGIAAQLPGCEVFESVAYGTIASEVVAHRRSPLALCSEPEYRDEQ